MKPRLRNAALLALLLILPMTTSCATVLGTAVSPITGGVDLAMKYGKPSQWYYVPWYFIGGAIAGPFKAFYNGVNHDASIFSDFDEYWSDFDTMFRPFRM